MTPQTVFFVFIGIICFNFIAETTLDLLNAKQFSDNIPDLLKGIYNEEDYSKSQNYNRVNLKFNLISSTLSLLIMLGFLFFKGFALVNQFIETQTNNPIIASLLFFAIIGLGSSIMNLPFSYYKTFVIETKFGFNTSTKKTYWLDQIKGLVLTVILGSAILALIVWLYQLTQNVFWIYAWGAITLFSVFMNLFYSKLIVPLFNKQSPLEEGSLRNAISEYATKVGFELDNIYVIDSSKRSTKANAYFSGFGKQKRITLYDTLIKDLSEEEIVAVLAHEVGHYKRKHILFNLATSTLTTGFTLYLLSLFLSEPIFAQALSVENTNFHIGFIGFGILYTPISEMTNLVMNWVSRVFEYQADNYAKNTYKAEPLISGLKNLSKSSLSNLTPNKYYVFAYYSHPTLLQRIKNLLD